MHLALNYMSKNKSITFELLHNLRLGRKKKLHKHSLLFQLELICNHQMTAFKQKLSCWNQTSSCHRLILNVFATTFNCISDLSYTVVMTNFKLSEARFEAPFTILIIYCQHEESGDNHSHILKMWNVACLSGAFLVNIFTSSDLTVLEYRMGRAVRSTRQPLFCFHWKDVTLYWVWRLHLDLVWSDMKQWNLELQKTEFITESPVVTSKFQS